jgi:glycosyltransferase involved in cell wall biosynthesis
VIQENKRVEKVTVIVPFYNVETYIKQCLESLVNQTHHNLEILCIDDCSPDDTLNIVHSYAARDNRIKVIKHEQNKGLGGARNTGIASASADYICFVDSDDYVAENFVERLYHTIKTEGSDIALCGFRAFYEDPEKILLTEYDDDTIVIDENKNNVFDCAHHIKGASWFKMYRRTLLSDNGIQQPERRYYEGVVFWLRSIYYSSKISTISDVLYHYRQRDGSIMRSFSHKHIEDRFDYIEQIDQFFRNEILSTPGIDVYKATHDALDCIMGHLYYGETLIRDFGGEANSSYVTHFHRELSRFSRSNNWPILSSRYKEYSKNKDSKLAQQKMKGKLSVDQLQLKLTNTQNKLAKAQRELDKVYSSRSWRVTSPLRRIVGVLKK